jgi:hypothetical protein
MLIIPAVVKLGEVQSDSGKHLVYLDNKDSIKIFIGVDQVVQKQEVAETSKGSKKEKTDHDSVKPENQDSKIVAVAPPVILKDTVVQTVAPTKNSANDDPLPKVARPR